MLVTSLKTMDEIRLGNILALPGDLTFEPWVKAWSEACTGLDCDGISVGFWNSVRILIPSVILSIVGRRAQRLRAVLLAGARRQLLFAILLLGAFIPYQVFLYPLVRHVLDGRHLQLAALHRDRPHHLRPADDDAAVPQLLRRRCRSSCSRRRASTAAASGRSSCG